MRKINTLYWVFTILLIPMFGIGAVVALTGSPAQVEVLTSLGYPSYLLMFLSLTKIVALIVIFSPNLSRLKEWAYAGLTFDVILAIYSLVLTHNSFTPIIIPLIALGLLAGSYTCHHRREKFKSVRKAFV